MVANVTSRHVGRGTYSLKESGILTELGDVCPVVMCEHLVAEYRICNLQNEAHECELIAEWLTRVQTNDTPLTMVNHKYPA